jgi:hypothetical protein
MYLYVSLVYIIILIKGVINHTFYKQLYRKCFTWFINDRYVSIVAFSAQYQYSYEFAQDLH